MDNQLLIVCVLVVLAAAYLTRRGYAVVRGKSGSCGGCSSTRGCSAPNINGQAIVPEQELTKRLRARRGSRDVTQ